ncbi:MAG: hypothetical protein ACRC92_20630 [Peptostreptococcaceae bacterium]
MGYRFYNDIKEEENEKMELQSSFRIESVKTGMYVNESNGVHTKSFIKDHYPNGLTIIEDTNKGTILYANFIDGVPNGTWQLVDAITKKVIREKYFNY